MKCLGPELCHMFGKYYNDVGTEPKCDKRPQSDVGRPLCYMDWYP